MFAGRSKNYRKSHSSAQTIINSYLRNGNLNVKARSGRLKKLSQREERLILNTVKANPRKSPPELYEELFQCSTKSVRNCKCNVKTTNI